jgi:hypothetical protein
MQVQQPLRRSSSVLQLRLRHLCKPQQLLQHPMLLAAYLQNSNRQQ